VEIIVIVLALAFLQVWGANNPLHKDSWFFSWAAFLESKQFVPSTLSGFLSVALPILVIAVLNELFYRTFPWLGLPLAVIVLLYSLGRGEFSEIVREYTQACYVENWHSAIQRAEKFNVHVDGITEGDWPSLHHAVFVEAGYRGFERLFAVLFWFLLLGPIGALIYRLVFLKREHTPSNALIARWLWLLEWPVARLVGFSFALTGNFSGCFDSWKDCVVCRKRDARAILNSMILGALTVSDTLPATCEITRKELSLMTKLYQRTLWLWVAVVAVLVLFI